MSCNLVYLVCGAFCGAVVELSIGTSVTVLQGSRWQLERDTQRCTSFRSPLQMAWKSGSHFTRSIRIADGNRRDMQRLLVVSKTN